MRSHSHKKKVCPEWNMDPGFPEDGDAYSLVKSSFENEEINNSIQLNLCANLIQDLHPIKPPVYY